MNTRTRSILIAVACAVWTIQIGLTVTNEIRWPFCCHNLYYHRSPMVKPVLKVRLRDNMDGEQLVDLRHLLPIDGYRTGAVFREAFDPARSETAKRAYARFILNRLNGTRWTAFDERFGPAMPTVGDRFVALSLERTLVDTQHYSTTREAPVVGTETLYTYDEEV